MAKELKLIVFHITIKDIEPPIWRRIAVDGDSTLRGLHHIIQAAFGWTSSHMHEFVINNHTYAVLENPSIQESMEMMGHKAMSDRRPKLERLMRPGMIFKYLYDFGDGWEHIVTVEHIENVSEKLGYAHVIGGERAGPPEDVGGPARYAEFLDTLLNRPDSQQAKDLLGWVGGEFDPEAFDRRATTNTLLRMAWNSWGKN